MAYNLSASPSSSLSNFNSLSPPTLLQLKTHKNRNFPQKFNPPKPSLRIHAKVSLQEPEIYPFSEDFKAPDEKTASKSRPYVWVNPKSPIASKLERDSNAYRYASLVKIAESLDSCSPTEEEISGILNILGDKILEQDAVIILNNMSNALNAPLVLSYFLERLKMHREVVLYNVALKVFRKCKDLIGAEKLFDKMLDRGVKPDNFTFSMIISCARQCSLPAKSVEWFEKMSSFGCEPDNVICSGMIDSYGRVGNVDAALSLYDRARSGKWRLDALTFSTLIKIHRSNGNFEGCLNIYEEMKALGVKPNTNVYNSLLNIYEEMTALGIKPNTSVYNSLLDAMGRAKRPWQVKNIYLDMVKNGIRPTMGTYAALIWAYTRAFYVQDALLVYREMKEKGYGLTVVLYNTILSACADVGLNDEALEIFEDMKSSGSCKPDSWTFSSLIRIHSCSGQVEEAEAKLTEMLEAGFKPKIYVLTSITQCYGKSGRVDDVVKTFDRVLEMGLNPDERFLSCLLNVLTHTKNEELGKLTSCIEKGHPKLGHIVKLIINGENEGLKNEARELFVSIGPDVKKGYCNCLIDLCVNLDQLERACELLKLGLELEIYKSLMSKSPTQWSLHLKSLSLGAALTALRVWMDELTRALENGEDMPDLLGINTGHGKHKFLEKSLAGVFKARLQELKAPFHEAPDKVGWFLTTKVAVSSWLESRRDDVVVAV